MKTTNPARANFYDLPSNLPIPEDDGACDHLPNQELPPIELRSTKLRTLNLSNLTQTPTVFFFYPRTGRPDEPAPKDWDMIPGARGCTPQSCAFRDSHQAFLNLGIQVFAASTQTTEFQQELAQRIHLPFEVLSDADLKLTSALCLPTFEFAGEKLLKRMAWYCEQGKIAKVFYPVFPPDKNADTVLTWLRENRQYR